MVEHIEKSMPFTQIVRPIVLLATFVTLALIIGVIAYVGWLEFSGQMEIRRLEAQAAALQAQAEADEAAADRANAEAVLAPAEAAAYMVRNNSRIVMYWAVLTPWALVVGALVLISFSTMAGALLALAVMDRRQTGGT